MDSLRVSVRADPAAVRAGQTVRLVVTVRSRRVACFVLTHLAANGAHRRRLVQVAALISGLMVSAAVGLAYFGVWVDVVYVIAAVWPLAALFAWRSGKTQRSTAAEPRALRPAGGVG